MEANPGTISEANFRGYRAAGVNRLSMGVQSLQRRAAAGHRAHPHGGRGGGSLSSAPGAPGSTTSTSTSSSACPSRTWPTGTPRCGRLRRCGTDHLSCYSLIVEEHTPLWLRVEQGQVVVPGEDAVADMYERCQATLAAAGLRGSTRSRTGATGHGVPRTTSSTGARSPTWASARARTATSAAGATGPSLSPRKYIAAPAGRRQRAGRRRMDRARPGDGRVHDARPAHDGGHRALRVRGALRPAVRRSLRPGGGATARLGAARSGTRAGRGSSFNSGTIAWERGLCALPAGLGAPARPARCCWRSDLRCSRRPGPPIPARRPPGRSWRTALERRPHSPPASPSPCRRTPRGSPITRAVVSYRFTGEAITRDVVATLTPAARVQVSAPLNTRSHYMPPGVEITYYWSLDDAAGDHLDTPPQQARYDDARYAWRVAERHGAPCARALGPRRNRLRTAVGRHGGVRAGSAARADGADAHAAGGDLGLSRQRQLHLGAAAQSAGVGRRPGACPRTASCWP